VEDCEKIQNKEKGKTLGTKEAIGANVKMGRGGGDLLKKNMGQKMERSPTGNRAKKKISR